MGTYGRSEATKLKGCDMVFETNLCSIPEARETQTHGRTSESWFL